MHRRPTQRIAALLCALALFSSAGPASAQEGGTLTPDWLRQARIAGAQLFSEMSAHEIEKNLSALAAQHVSVVEADSELSRWLTEKDFAREISLMRRTFAGTVAGMSGQDAIDFTDIDFSKVQTPGFSGDSSGGLLTVANGTHAANVALIGNYLASTFVASSDGHGGTSVIDPPLSTATQQMTLTPAHA